MLKYYSKFAKDVKSGNIVRYKTMSTLDDEYELICMPVSTFVRYLRQQGYHIDYRWIEDGFGSIYANAYFCEAKSGDIQVAVRHDDHMECCNWTKDETPERHDIIDLRKHEIN